MLNTLIVRTNLITERNSPTGYSLLSFLRSRPQPLVNQLYTTYNNALGIHAIEGEREKKILLLYNLK